MTQKLSTISIGISLLGIIACNSKNYRQPNLVNDTTRIIQGVLDSKMIQDSVFQIWEGMTPTLYTRFLIKGKTFETLHLVDSNFAYRGRKIHICDTAFDEDPYKYPRPPKHSNFAIGLGNILIGKDGHAKMAFRLIEANLEIKAQLKKENDKWVVEGIEQSNN